jgi:hypothetical protein
VKYWYGKPGAKNHAEILASSAYKHKQRFATIAGTID